RLPYTTLFRSINTIRSMAVGLRRAYGTNLSRNLFWFFLELFCFIAIAELFTAIGDSYTSRTRYSAGTQVWSTTWISTVMRLRARTDSVVPHPYQGIRHHGKPISDILILHS